MAGHPDDQTYANWRGPDFAASNAFSLSNTTPFEVASYITNFASFVVFAAPTNAGGTTVIVNFYTDQTKTISLGGFSWIVPGNMILHVTVPGLGNYVDVRITTPDVAAANMFVAVYPTNTPVESPSYAGPGNFAQDFNVSVAASTTLLVPLPYVAQGHGYVYVVDPNTTGHFVGGVVTLKSNGTANARIVAWNTLGPFQSQEFAAPGTPIAVFVQNTDGAAAHFANYFLCVDGR